MKEEFKPYPGEILLQATAYPSWGHVTLYIHCLAVYILSRLIESTWLLVPDSMMVFYWRIFIVCVSVIFSIIHSYVASYCTGFNRAGYGSSVDLELLFGFTYIVDFIFYVDMIFQSRTAVYNENDGLLHVLLFPCYKGSVYGLCDYTVKSAENGY